MLKGFWSLLASDYPLDEMQKYNHHHDGKKLFENSI